MENIKTGSISVKDFKTKMKQNFVLIDIRTSAEIKEGKIEGLDLELDFYDSNFKKEITKLDKDRKYLLYCRSGSRTGMALVMMEKLGFKEVYDLWGGLMIWSHEGEKLVK